MFYLFPLAAKKIGPIGMVLAIVAATFVLGLMMGHTAGFIRFLYPVLAAALFVPSVFLYYNKSALVQAVWYLVIAFAGVVCGTLLHRSSAK